MALPADFSKIFGSTATGGLTPIGDVNYAKGWEFVGSNPPTKNDFSYLQNLSDLKSQWLYSNKLQRANPFGDIKSDGTVQAALSNLGLGDAAKLGSPEFSFLGTTFIAKFPGKIGGSNQTIVIQGLRVTIPQATSGNIATLSVSWPTPFPTNCQFTIISAAGTTYAPGYNPFFGIAPVDRLSCLVSSTYTASSSSAFILGVGY